MNLDEALRSHANLPLAVAMGQIPGARWIDKFGENPELDLGDAEDIWDGGGTYTYDADSTAPIVSLASDDDADNMDIRITGLDIDGYEVVQTVTLTGTTRVALPTPLWRVYRMENDGSTSITGTVFCYTGTGTVPVIGDSTVRAVIVDGNNQTLMAIYTVPKGYVGYLLRGEVGMSRTTLGGVAQCAYYSRRYGKVFKIKKRVDISQSGTSVYTDKRSIPDVIPALTDIKLRVENASANDTGVIGTFDILLVPETNFSDAYLSAIFQPGY